MPLSYLKNTTEQKEEFTESLMFFFWLNSHCFDTCLLFTKVEETTGSRVSQIGWLFESRERIWNKIAKSCMKITKSTFIDLGQNGRGNMWGQANLLSSRETHPIPPHKGSPVECMHVGVCVLERRGWGWGGVNQCHEVDFWVHVIFSGQFCQGGWLCLRAKTSLSKYMNHEPSLTKNDW